MITRLKVKGFKNLSEIDLRFGPFTCVAGINGVGKSNLFDAIRFLSLLSTHTIHEAAVRVRDDDARSANPRLIFRQVADGYEDIIEFEVEMIIPRQAADDLNQTAKATSTFLVYTLKLRWVGEHKDAAGPIQVEHEALDYIPQGKARQSLGFEHDRKWRDEVIRGRRTSPYISCENLPGEKTKIKAHQDGGSSGKPKVFLAESLPRTVLSSANANETPTVLCARREMQSWRLLQLEPSSLRLADPFNSTATMNAQGGHLPATLNRLDQAADNRNPDGDNLQAVANRLRELVPDIRRLRIDRDERRELFTLMVKMREGTEYAARSLSDGTLRFLALVVLEADPKFQGVLCFEEPENGIHPERIPAIIQLLKDIALDPLMPPGDDNPLRQVIINTHSPEVVRLIDEDSLVVAYPVEAFQTSPPQQLVRFGYLGGTWREAEDGVDRDVIASVSLVPFLRSSPGRLNGPTTGKRRVIDREEFTPYFPNF
jgi:predicted ATPase